MMNKPNLTNVAPLKASQETPASRPVPALTPGQIALHGGLTVHQKAFSLEANVTRTKTWFLPQDPGPFGTLEEWTAWRDELLTMGAENQGVDVELAVANKWIAELHAESSK